MTGAVPTLSRYLPRATGAGRIRLALAASAFIHLLLAAVLVSGVPPRSGQPESVALITARIEPLPWSDAVHATAADNEDIPRPRPVKQDIAVPDDARRKAAPKAAPKTASGMEQGAAQPPALPQLPDLTVYTARDLDSYPRPVFPLDVERLAERAAGLPPAGVRLELLIDEHGIVNDVAVAEPGLSNYLETQLRAVVAATRFVPARKDGRAVRSRVLLSVSFETKNRND